MALRRGAGSLQRRFAYRRARSSVANRPRHSSTAIVVHAYYPEEALAIRDRIRAVAPTLDTVVTVPDHSPAAAAGGWERSWPEAGLVRVPNRGRDVLPFLQIAPELRRLGYTGVLKLHTKRSLHTADGRHWFNDSLSKLLPTPAQVATVTALLADPRTGVVGPIGYYHPLWVAFAENRTAVGEVLARVRPPLPEGGLDGDAFGFFGGTMFWARLDAFTALDRLRPDDFPPERGQINGTAAHACERLFCLLPAWQGRTLYTLGPAGATVSPLAGVDVPVWAQRD
ncbi:MAG: rhamnan synthesis F family protein [Propioniciclava sp.]